MSATTTAPADSSWVAEYAKELFDGEAAGLDYLTVGSARLEVAADSILRLADYNGVEAALETIGKTRADLETLRERQLLARMDRLLTVLENSDRRTGREQDTYGSYYREALTWCPDAKNLTAHHDRAVKLFCL